MTQILLIVRLNTKYVLSKQCYQVIIPNMISSQIFMKKNKLLNKEFNVILIFFFNIAFETNNNVLSFSFHFYFPFCSRTIQFLQVLNLKIYWLNKKHFFSSFLNEFRKHRRDNSVITIGVIKIIVLIKKIHKRNSPKN